VYRVTEKTFRYVPFDEVEDYQRLGWMIAVPLKWHPALDAYRALMMRFCDCELAGISK
jgi:hypothetical protein